MNISTSDTIAFTAAIVATCSLAITIWQGWIARSHNRKSVRPILTWARDWSSSATGTTLCFYVINVGLGPGIVLERHFKRDGVLFNPVNEDNHVGALLSAVIGQQITYVARKHGLPGIGSAIPAGAKFVIAEIEFPSASRQQVEDLLDSIVVAFELRYESIYAEKKMLLS
jgi:hypothetical protein